MNEILSDNYTQMTVAELAGEIDQTEAVLASFEVPRHEVMAHLLGSVSIWDGTRFNIDRAGIIQMRFVPAEDAPVEQVYKSWPVPAASENFPYLSSKPLEVARIRPVEEAGKKLIEIVSVVMSSYTKDYSKHRDRTVRVSAEEVRNAGHRFLVSPKNSDGP